MHPLKEESFYLFFHLFFNKKKEKETFTLYLKEKKIKVQQEPQIGWVHSPGVLSTYIYIAPDCKNMTYNFIKVVIWVNHIAFSLPFPQRGTTFYWLPPFFPGWQKLFQSGVKRRICTFNKSWTPLTIAAKFKMAELLPLKMYLFTSFGIPKHHWLWIM